MFRVDHACLAMSRICGVPVYDRRVWLGVWSRWWVRVFVSGPPENNSHKVLNNKFFTTVRSFSVDFK